MFDLQESDLREGLLLVRGFHILSIWMSVKVDQVDPQQIFKKQFGSIFWCMRLRNQENSLIVFLYVFHLGIDITQSLILV